MKLRFFALDSEQKLILPGAFVRTYLAVDDGKPETPERQITLGSARADHAGYGRIDLDRLLSDRENFFERLLALGAASGNLGWFIEVAGCPEFRVDILSAFGVDRKPDGLEPMASSSLPDAQGVAKILQSLAELSSPFLLKADDKAEIGPVGHVSDPDSLDYKFSPESFVSRRGAKTGDDGCEHLTPATLPLRQYPIYHIAVHDNGGESRAKDLPSVNATPRKDHRILWGQILEFEQSWSSLGHSLGEVKYSLALAPGEAVKIAVIDWKRDDTGSRTASNTAKDALLHDQTVDRDIEDIVSGRVSERQSGESFMAGLAGAADFSMPQIGLSAAGRHSVGYGMSNTQGNRDVSSEAHQDVHLRTLQRSNLARSQNSSVVVQATQAESNYLSTRIVANMNRGHSLTVLYYEVLRHLAVRTEFRRADTAILVPVDMFAFDGTLARRFRAQLEPVLLDSKYKTGFDALELLAAGHVSETPANDEPPVVTPPTTSGPSPIATQFEISLTTEWRWSSLLNRYNAPADTAGSIEVVAELQDDSRVKLVDLPARPPVFEQFHDMNNWSARWPEWSFVIEENGGRMIAIRRLANQAVDLRTIKQVLVRWRRVQPIGGEFDGWNLKKLAIRATAGDGASYQLVDHAYTLDTGRRELFPPTTSNDFIDNTQAPLLSLNFNTPAPAPTPAPTPAPSNSGGGTASHTSGDLAEQAMLLINHLNANQYYYNANAWLLMDSRERRLRLADYVGPLLAGMSDVPLVMSGNHLAFRYSAKDLPAAAREVLPASTAALKPQEDIITLPTRGIFAEAHLGHCNAAEKRDITRLWNFDELPVSLLPNIDTLTAGPRGTAANLTPDSMGASPLDIQGTPTLPAPGEAIAQALELLAKPDIFRDQSTREQVAEIMGKLIESAQPPKMTGDNIGSAVFGNNGAKGSSASAKPSGTASDPSEWANPFPDRSLEVSDGQSLLAEKYKNYSLLDQYDAFKVAPELSEALDKAGIPKETKTELISGVVKGTTARVQKTAQVKPTSRRVAIGLRSRSTFTAGVERALNGNITLEFSEPGSLRSMMPFSLLVPVNGGTGNQYATLVPSQYAVNARYAPASKADLDFLREPHLESIGVNFDTLIRGVFDLLQQDFATDWNITAPIEGDLIEIDDKTTSVRLKLTAEMEESAAMAFDAEFGIEEGFTIHADGSVNFDTAGLAAMAEKIAETLKIEQAALVGALLSLFTIKASVGADKKSTISGATKVQIHFKPAILKRFVLTKID